MALSYNIIDSTFSYPWFSQMHLVHFNSAKYPNISLAIDKSDGLAVLGVFIEVS